MTPKEFIISELNNIITNFPDVQCRYRYDQFCESHYVEITPVEEYKKSKALKTARINLLDGLFGHFPDESIVFFTDGDLIKMGDAEFSITGYRYFKGVDTFALKVYTRYLKSKKTEIEHPTMVKFYDHQQDLAGFLNKYGAFLDCASKDTVIKMSTENSAINILSSWTKSHDYFLNVTIDDSEKEIAFEKITSQDIKRTWAYLPTTKMNLHVEEVGAEFENLFIVA